MREGPPAKARWGGAGIGIDNVAMAAVLLQRAAAVVVVAGGDGAADVDGVDDGGEEFAGACVGPVVDGAAVGADARARAHVDRDAEAVAGDAEPRGDGWAEAAVSAQAVSGPGPADVVVEDADAGSADRGAVVRVWAAELVGAQQRPPRPFH